MVILNKLVVVVLNWMKVYEVFKLKTFTSGWKPVKMLWKMCEKTCEFYTA